MSFWNQQPEEQKAEDRRVRDLVEQVEDVLSDTPYSRNMSPGYRDFLESLIEHAHDTGRLSEAQEGAIKKAVESWERGRGR